MSEEKFPEEKFIESVPDKFWKIIEEARQDPNRFRQMLKKMSREEITHFCWTYEELANQLREDYYYDYVDPDLSEDGLAELASWVVAQGKDYYLKVWEDPEQIPPKKNDVGLTLQAIREYEERFNDDVPINTNEWDDEWKSHGKKSPWG
jgi:hypothetical protein